MTKTTKVTQEERVLAVLMLSPSEWINGQYFLRDMMLSQYHRALWNLIHKAYRYKYLGTIEVSSFVDSFGFKSYRYVPVSFPVID